MNTERIYVMGVGFDPLAVEDAKGRIGEMLSGGTGKTAYAVTPNPSMLMDARSDGEFRKILNSADLVLCDGTGVIGAAKRQGTPLPGRIAGIEAGEAAVSLLAEKGGSLFLIGGRPGRAGKACENLKLRYPELRISGYADGYEQSEDTENVIRRINGSGADLLIVCLGTPKQEKWIYGNLEKLSGVKLAMALGGSVDVWSGCVKRAPRFFIRMRMEWLWRMIADPRKFGLLPKLIKFRFLTRKRGNSGPNN